MNTCCSVIGALGLAACSSAALTGPGVVVATTPASAAECPFGGTIVSSGSDDNGNGVLDDGETARRTAVCDDPPAPSPTPIAVRLVAEPAGAHCALDGTAVQSGPDRNLNGALDDEEVARTDYACGESLLTRLAVAAPDARCIAGGVAFLAGRDRNHDGRLEDDEVEQREVSCGDQLARDVAIRDAADAAALAGIAVITGSLTIDDTALGEIALPRLVQVRGGVVVERNAALVRVSLPALESIDGALALALDPALTALDLPLLHRVGGVVLAGNAALNDVGGLAALDDVTGDVQISNNGALASVDLAIDRVRGGLTIDGNPRLAHIAWSTAGQLGAVHIASNEQLASVELTGTAAGRLTEVGGVTLASNHALDRAALDADDLGALAIRDNPLLTDVAVTGVRVGGGVSLVANGQLRLGFSALAQDAFTIAGELTVSGPVHTITSSRPLVVRSDCTIDRTHLTALGPEQVSRVGGEFLIRNNPRLSAISTLPVGGAFEVRGNHALIHLGFEFGEQYHGVITIVNNELLEDAPFDGLKRVAGYLTINSNPSLKAFARSLEEVTGSLTIGGNDSLTDLGLTHLWHAGGLIIDSSGGLTEVELPALTRAEVFGVAFFENPELRHIRFPVLRSANFLVLGNPRLPACELIAMFALIGGTHQQRSNDDTAVCGP